MISSSLLKYAEGLKKYQRRGKKILCAISGGVDSAVAVGLLKAAGFDVTGAFIKCFSDVIEGNKTCWIDERRDATRVAAKLKIPLLTFDFEKEYRRDVIDYLFKEYRAGRTPNPDVMCNKYVKIPLLLKEAERRGFDLVATGHYAGLLSVNMLKDKQETGKKNAAKDKRRVIFSLREAADKNKDQTYFLHQLGQKELSRLIFPLANITKKKVRIFAKELELSVAEKEESMGICFVGEVLMKIFLKKEIKSRPGNIVLSSGKVVGRHDGLAFYTLGQRVGLPLRAKAPACPPITSACLTDKQSGQEGSNLIHHDTKPLYAVKKDMKKNLLVVGFANDPLLFSKSARLAKVNWISGRIPKLPLKCKVRLRHRQKLQDCIIYHCEDCGGEKTNPARRLSIGRHDNAGNLLIKFVQPQRAVTPGQFAVFYLNGECFGGGAII